MFVLFCTRFVLFKKLRLKQMQGKCATESSLYKFTDQIFSKHLSQGVFGSIMTPLIATR